MHKILVRHSQTLPQVYLGLPAQCIQPGAVHELAQAAVGLGGSKSMLPWLWQGCIAAMESSAKPGCTAHTSSTMLTSSRRSIGFKPCDLVRRAVVGAIPWQQGDPGSRQTAVVTRRLTEAGQT